MKARRALVLVASLAALPALADDPALIPITTSSTEARALYLEGRALVEALRVNEARSTLEAAVAKDPGFALAWLQLSGVSNGQAFFDALKKAAALAPGVSEGERHLVLATEAGVAGDSEKQLEHLRALAAGFPRDPRALVPLATFRLGRQEFEAAVELYRKALELDPRHAFAWNQLGYALRFLARYDEAEKAFASYVALVPDDPNPYDSQAELFLKVGKYDQAIASYRRTLAIDPGFFNSYVGIANAQIGLDRYADARATLKELRAVAKAPADVRTSVFWTAMTWLHEGKPRKALSVFQENLDQSTRVGDLALHSADLVVAGNVQLHAGRVDEALRSFERAVAAMERASVPEEVKENVRRNHRYFVAWAAAMRGDLPALRTNADAYRARVAARLQPFEVRRVHELDGQAALLAKDHGRAVATLRQANGNDPYVQVLLARALEGAGSTKEAREAWRAAAEYNELGFPISWAAVRAEARGKVKALASR